MCGSVQSIFHNLNIDTLAQNNLLGFSLFFLTKYGQVRALFGFLVQSTTRRVR